MRCVFVGCCGLAFVCLLDGCAGDWVVARLFCGCAFMLRVLCWCDLLSVAI